jgi:ATP-dependent DNA helicase RecG
MAPHPMNRLIQGDVGCGKTIVALMTALVAIENGTQVAVVAPTEILAEQHFLQFRHWLDQLGLKAVLLRGKMPAAEKRSVLEEIRAGRAHLVVGTHAVLQEGVEFEKLGLGVIDEQHRFGVRQRAVLRQKGMNPHILVMTATPIPRTLSMTLYGDLALSVIDEMPPGRTPVETSVIPEKQRDRAYDLMRRELDKGHQVYVVYPLVEETEKSDLLAATEGVEYLKNKVFQDVSIGLLHGRVEHAERFGLAQLHQLRGRVGRGEAGGQCLLIKSVKCSEDGNKRLEVMKRTNDGFQIAEADLEIRGPGEFLGTRQSGLPDFRVANILRDSRILEAARRDAFQLIEQSKGLSSPEYDLLRHELKHRWGQRLELASVG